MTGPSALLLDLDRTLVDLQSHTDYTAAWADLQTLAAMDDAIDLPETDWDAATMACMSTLVALAGTDAWPSASAAVAVHERAAIPASTPMPHLAEAAARWQGVPVAVVTLLPTDVAAEVLAHHGIAIPVIVGRDPGIRAKPSGDGLRVACERLSRPVDGAVMIGDSSWDEAAARDAGCGFIGVPVAPGVFGTEVVTAPHLAAAVRLAGVRVR